MNGAVVMARSPKGIKRVVRRGPDGEIVSVYYYAWKGGPRLVGKPGSREFVASYAAALQGQKRKPADTLAGLALRYQASPEFAGLADSTQKEWRRRIATICADEGELDIGGIPIEALNDPRVKADILAWRDQWQATPRGADFRMQVLSRVLSWGQQRGLLTVNVATGVGWLYRNNRADQVWTADELDRYVAASSSPEISVVAPLACLVGLRLDDLHTLLWSEIGEAAITKVTKKGRGKRTAVIPLLAETRKLLADIRSQQIARHAELTARAVRLGRTPPDLPLTVLANTFGRPWRYSGLVARVGETKAAATPPIKKHLHDARGTFATRLRKAGLTAPEIADALGWDEDRVERLLTVYVDRNTIVQGIAERIQRLEAEARRHDNPAHPVSDFVVEKERVPLRQVAGVVIPVDFRRSQKKAEVSRKPEQVRMPTAAAQGPPRARVPVMRYPLIGLCAYLGSQGVERRSPWVSDEWLGAEIARDPWLFRTVEFEPGYFPLTDDASAVRWGIPDVIGRQMGEELRVAYA